MSPLQDDRVRVLVTARCRRKGHVLAEYVINEDGQKMIRVRHHRAVPQGNPNDREWDRLFGGLASLTGAADLAVTPSCPCGRPHVVTLAALEAAAAAGVSVIFVDPVRDSMP